MLVRLVAFSAMAASLSLAACVGPGLTGNDRGGIIPWSPASWDAAPDLAREHCARYNKSPRLTGVAAEYGGYISFACLYDPRFNH
ncbi:MAG TPA: hypothetical protein VHV58_08955 [Pseudolabrys sp.]|jgi:hypothetical protein|nr:hypothetical protein [Pseudolabrys sp.]